MDIIETENGIKICKMGAAQIENFYLQVLNIHSLLRVIIEAMEYVSDVEDHIKISTYIAEDHTYTLMENLKNLMNKLEINIDKFQVKITE